MIIVTVKDNSISITGHACRKESSGIDRACTAVSALTCSLINSLQDLTHDKIKVEDGGTWKRVISRCPGVFNSMHPMV